MAVPHYVFAANSADELVQQFTDHLGDYLADPTGATSRFLPDELKTQALDYATQAGVVGQGLAQVPRFVLRPGSGKPGDEPVLGNAEIIYLNDDPPGGPYVRIIVDEMGNAEDWPPNQVLQPVAFVVDNYADEWAGTLTEGRDAHDATAALQGVTWRLLSPVKLIRPLLKTWGFCNPGTRAGAPEREGITLRAPFTFGADIYYRQKEG